MTTRILLIAAALLETASAASMAVDWLQYQNGGGPGGFSLANDSGIVSAGGKLVVGSGASMPGFPAGRTLNSQFWETAPQAGDSVLGNGTVSAFDVRVAPQAGAASYSIELSVPTGRGLVLMVGDLFSGAAGSTAGITLTAVSDTGSSTISLIEILGWDNGVKASNKGLLWNGTDTLTTTGGADGDSKYAFFEIGALSGPNARIVLNIPEGYNQGAGESITLGLGLLPIPEPGISALACVGFCLLLRKRMR